MSAYRTRGGSTLTVVRVALLVVLVVLLAGCASSAKPSPADCRRDLIAELLYLHAHPRAPQDGLPASCNGVPKATLRAYALQAALDSIPEPAAS